MIDDGVVLAIGRGGYSVTAVKTLYGALLQLCHPLGNLLCSFRFTWLVARVLVAKRPELEELAAGWAINL